MKALIAHLGGCYGEGGDMSVEQFFKHSVQRTAHLAAAWQVWGCVAGTLNTDDISALGVTLDPGSGAFLESCQASLTEDCDAVDSVYAFSSQSESIRFGLEVLGRALRLLLHEEQINACLLYTSPSPRDRG